MLHLIIEQWQPFIAITLIFIFLVLETIVPFFKPKKDKLQHGLRNILIAIINGLVLIFIFSGITLYVANYAETEKIGLLNIIYLSMLVHSIAAFIIMDLWNYTWHRINHIIPFLWRFHKMHHSDPNMDVTTALRFHVGEIIFSSIVRLFIILIVGIPIWILIIYDSVLLSSTLFHHSNFTLPPKLDKAVRILFVTPNMHKVHHSRIKIETDSNYSSFLTIWDRMFKSFRLKNNYRKINFGLDNYDGEEKQSLIGLIKTPLLK